jgi:hypothetical protein
MSEEPTIRIVVFGDDDEVVDFGDCTIEQEFGILTSLLGDD